MVSTNENWFYFLPGNNKPKLTQVWIKIETKTKTKLKNVDSLFQKQIIQDLDLISHGL